MAGAEKLEQLSDELHNALWPILLNKPANPLLFLCSHFRDVAGISSNPVSTAYRTLRLCSSEGQHYETNIKSAYKALADPNGHVPSDMFLQLLTMLTDGLPKSLSTSLMQLFTLLGQLSPSFAVFRDAVKACMLLEEIAMKPQQGAPPGHMFQLPEAKKLLVRLLQQHNWLLSTEPLQQVQRLRAVHLPRPAGPQELLDVKLAAEAADTQAAQLVELALEAREAG